MAHRTAVILVVGLTESLLGPDCPRIRAFRARGALCTLKPRLPAVTCTSQACMLTGAPPSAHGVVANGWYERDSAEIRFWRQSNRLMRGEKVWDVARARDASFTCAQLFWWFNMHARVDWSATPRPIYKADGRKIPDCYAEPPELRDDLQSALGRFPLFSFWGPASSIASSEWIARAARRVDATHHPTLSLVYLPHLDYALQKHGPGVAESQCALKQIDAVVGDLLDHYEARGVRVMLVSEYGVEPVSAPIHVNRALRAAGLLRVRTELGREQLDPGASRAFAVADHQIAHVYIRDAADAPAVRSLCESIEGVELALNAAARRGLEVDHDRAGDLLLVATRGRWFTYYHWLDDARAPDFARTVDIHRKPGYDPAELFIDPALRAPGLTIARKLLARKLGFRTLLNVVPLDASLVRGSHGRVDMPPGLDPIVISGHGADDGATLPIEAVRDLILESLFSDEA